MDSKVIYKAGLIVIALLLLPLASAFVCENVTVAIAEPQDLNYTYSINIPFEFTIVNGTDCWFILDSEKFYDNMSIGCEETLRPFDVDYDGNYTLTVFAKNVTDTGYCNVSSTFTIDRTSEFEEGKLTLIVLLIIGLFAAASYALYFGDKLEKPFQVMTKVLSFLFIYISLALMLLVTREYIKVPAIQSTVEQILTATIYMAIIILFVTTAMFIFNIIHNVSLKKNKERFGEG